MLHEKNIYLNKIDQLQELCERVRHQLAEIIEIKNAYQYESRLESWCEYILTYDKLENLEEWMDKCSHREHFRHFWDVKRLLEKLDIAISRRYGSATHGSMSRIMTITEKYTWCAKMELLGYLYN